MTAFNFQNKKIRAEVIRDYMQENNIKRAVCFSCGNASRELKRAGVDVVDVSPCGDFEALRWFSPAEIERTFPCFLDATSGHLNIDLMNRLSRAFKAHLKDIPPEIYLPTGSGETLVALKMAFPKTKIHAVYNTNNATKYEEEAPLNALVELLAESITR